MVPPENKNNSALQTGETIARILKHVKPDSIILLGTPSSRNKPIQTDKIAYHFGDIKLETNGEKYTPETLIKQHFLPFNIAAAYTKNQPDSGGRVIYTLKPESSGRKGGVNSASASFLKSPQAIYQQLVKKFRPHMQFQKKPSSTTSSNPSLKQETQLPVEKMLEKVNKIKSLPEFPEKMEAVAKLLNDNRVNSHLKTVRQIFSYTNPEMQDANSFITAKTFEIIYDFGQAGRCALKTDTYKTFKNNLDKHSLDLATGLPSDVKEQFRFDSKNSPTKRNDDKSVTLWVRQADT